ncbi:MAG: Lrp/AsnC ligand binding domain-containing protein [DPANN group archaeon]|nr:Lrp/AsnC ligand binding domain-containing protein [DPANN group archaeon]
MVTAFILIVADSGCERKIADKLADAEGVEEVDVIYGDYDLVAKIRVSDISKLGDFVMDNIRTIKGVRRTSTLIAVSD